MSTPKMRGQKTPRIIELHGEGLTVSQIANTIGSGSGNVREILIRHGFKPNPGLRGRPPTADPQIVALKPYAEARGIRPHDLAQRLLTVIIKDHLVDAILDDEAGR